MDAARLILELVQRSLLVFYERGVEDRHHRSVTKKTLGVSRRLVHREGGRPPLMGVLKYSNPPESGCARGSFPGKALGCTHSLEGLRLGIPGVLSEPMIARFSGGS